MIQKNTHDSRFCDHFDKDSRTQDLKEKRRINRAEGEAEDSKQSGRAEFPVVFLVASTKGKQRARTGAEEEGLTTGKGLEPQPWLWSSTEVMSTSE